VTSRPHGRSIDIEATVLAALMTTRVDRPESVGRERLVVRLSGLGAWPWYLATIACFVIADRLAGWPSLIPMILGLASGMYGLTSYGHRRDGLSKHRQ
jgi:hypothetical protein